MADPQDTFFWFATAPVGAASVLAEELAHLGATHVRERSTDVRFQGPMEVGYRACLWSRSATRVFLSLGSVDATTSPALYAGARRIDWREHIANGATLACDCSGGNDAIRHTVYGAQLLKDAVCDSLRDATGWRPDIRPEQPDVQLHLHVEGAQAVISVDFSGESLHRRGYRLSGGRAPLKENLAAAILLRCGWSRPDTGENAALLDPMCGSGTFLIEAAAVLADVAPALHRKYFGFTGWRGFERVLWDKLRHEAAARAQAIAPRRCVVGYDIDSDAVHSSLENVRSAGLDEWVHVEKRALAEVQSAPAKTGLLVTNPPYGERIGAESGLPALYEDLGRVLRGPMLGWQAGVLTGNPPLATQLGVYAKRTHRFMNGPIECRLLRFDLRGELKRPMHADERAERPLQPGAQMVANRLKKNLHRLDAWATRQNIECFRVYDADMPEYAFAIDCYGRSERHIFVQEYAPPSTVDEEGARKRRRELLSALPQVFAVPLGQIHTRVRRAQKGAAQYERQGESAERTVVNESGLKFLVNFHQYLDTGLFLDHRITRQMIRDFARDKNFLNLFCYTGSATVYAAAGGARRSLSIDLSNTYLQWARDNLDLNGFERSRHELLSIDCMQWLAAQASSEPDYDLIFIDPPTFSNSKRMSGVLDVQRDHLDLILAGARLMRLGGQMVFSTNYSRFRLDEAGLAQRGFKVEDITSRTISRDFERNATIHRCYIITR